MLFSFRYLTWLLMFSPICSSTSELSLPTENDITITKAAVVKKETQTCLKKAREFAKKGKRKSASKLFDHALKLDPQSSDVFNLYGEFQEEENIVEADAMYQKAAILDPTNNRAVLNRKRTAPIVADLDQKRFTHIERAKDELVCLALQLESAWNETIYALNKTILTLKGKTHKNDKKIVLDNQTQISRKKLLKHKWASKDDEAIIMRIWKTENLSYPNITLRIKISNITVIDIKNIHIYVLKNANPSEAGKFRTRYVDVGRYTPPDYCKIEKLMEQFEGWLNSKESLNLYPIEYAAIAHYRLVEIHPFVDGNGRTARILMNYILAKHNFPPVSIKSKYSSKYYEHLIKANDGDVRPFIRFIAECVQEEQDNIAFSIIALINCVTIFPYLLAYLVEELMV